MFTGKAKKVYGNFLTRKDFHHENKRPENILVWYKKKKFRIIANRKVRKYRDCFSNGEFKKVAEVKWEVI